MTPVAYSVDPGAAAPSPRGPWGARQHLSALLLFTVLTGAIASPVIGIMIRGDVPGWEGDNLYYVHSMWWWKRALFDLRQSPFVDPESFFPYGRENGRSELTVTNTVPAIPITWLFGPVASYNLVILLSFVATGFFTYLWVFQLTGRRDAGLLAGTIVAFMPIRFAQIPGHLPQMTTQWIPLTLYACERFVDRRTIGRGLIVGVSVALVTLGCWYYGYSLAILLPLYVILRTWRLPVWREHDWWIGIAAAGGIALVLIAPFAYEMFKLRGEGQLSRTLDEMDSWGLNPYDFFIPNLVHPLWGESASRWFPQQRNLWVERGVALGYVAAGLAAAGWLSFRRRNHVIAVLAATWAVSFLIALGPTLHWRDAQVRVPVAPDLARFAARHLTGIGSEGDTRATRESYANLGAPIPLPSLFMFKYVPMTTSMRVMSRFAVWTMLMTAALAGFGLLAITGWAERRWGAPAPAIVPALAIALVAFESLAVVQSMPLSPRPVDRWLATQPARMVIVELPIDQAQRPMQNYWMTVNQRRNLFGWVGDSFPPPIQLERAAGLKDFPSPAAFAYLQRSAATHLLVTPAQVPNWSAVEPILRGSPALADEQAIGEVRVYRIVRDVRGPRTVR
jgi:hypothetical protein